MTVKQLIAKLSKLPQNLRVVDHDIEPIVSPFVQTWQVNDDPKRQVVILANAEDKREML